MGPVLLATVHLTAYLLLGLIGNTHGSVSDVEGGVSYRLEDLTGTFAFENGVVVTAASIDCESQSAYVIPLYAISTNTEEDTATATLLVTVTDVNDHTPVFNPKSYSATTPNGKGLEVLRVTATDGDCTQENSEISYSLEEIGNFGTQRFSINTVTGSITTSVDIDPGSYILTARASDKGGLSANAAIAVTVTMSCGDPPGVDNGSVDLNGMDTLVGATANVSCNRGFHPGDPVVECLENGNWQTPRCIETNCTALTDPLNGTVAVESLTAGSNATYECDAGFDLVGTVVLTCTADGNWSALPPTCRIKDCGNPPTIANGRFTTDTGNTTFGSRATYACNTGYTMTGRSSIVCLYNATWDHSPPTCTKIECTTLPDPSHGSVSHSNVSKSYGSTASYTCNTGYELSGTSTRTCQADGTWNGTTPSCTIKKCTTLPNPSHGSVSHSNDSKSYGSTASYTCNTGYELSRTSTRTCQADGTWNGTTPSCIIKKCTTLPDPSHGSVSHSNVSKSYGSTASYTCNTGYELSGTSTRTCQADGTWNGTTPSCTIKKCTTLPNPSHGSVSHSNDSKSYGSTASYTCNTGYELSGTSTRTCQADGTWNGTTPSCIIKKCTTLPDPSHGSVSHSNVSKSYGSTASYTCNTGYELSGTSTRTCQADGTWNGTTPSCTIKKCTTLPDPSHGSVSHSNVSKSYGSTASYTCNTGYELSGTSTRTCQADGTWNGTTPSCTIKKCTTLPNPSHGSVSHSNDSKSYGSRASYTCNTGYELSGTSTRTCQADGTWNGTTPSCIIKKCTTLPDPSHGSVSHSDDSKSYGSTASYTCNTGYELLGTSTRTCQADGTWNGTTPSCTIKKCSSLQAPSHGSVSHSDATRIFGSTASYTCNTGYELPQSSTRTCQANGTWSGNTPSCTIKNCGDIGPLPSQVSVTYSNGMPHFESTARFTCTAGYTISSSQLLTCRADGTWSSGSPPTCTIKDCGKLNLPGSGSVSTSTGTTFGSTATYTCNSGFTLYGDKMRKCLSSGFWGGVAASCTRSVIPVTQCSVDVDNRQTQWKPTPAGTSRVEECPDGFTGNASRKCNNAGGWEKPIYNCLREVVRSIKNKVAELSSTSSLTEVQDALAELSEVTVETTGNAVEETNRLTHGELSSLSSAVRDIAKVLDEAKIDSNTQNDFLGAASDLIDFSHSETWVTVKQSEGIGAERIIGSVDRVAEIITRKFKASDTDTTAIAKKNIVMEVLKIENKNINFPDLSSSHADWKDANTRAFIPKEALNGINVYATGIIFRDMIDIATAQDESGNNRVINGPVLAMSIDPPSVKLQQPLQMHFELSSRDNNKDVKRARLFSDGYKQTGYEDPSCNFWQSEKNTWSDTGCTVVSSNSTMTVCECDHLTNFAVLMSPFVEADAESTALRIISIVGIGVSIVCLIATLVIHFHLWKFLRNDRTTILMHLCVALLVSYVVFLAGVDRTESRVFCAIVAAFLQYIYLVVFCVMLAEGVEIGITLLFVFVKRSRIKPMMTAAWFVPAVIVSISLGVTKADGYGNKNFCWLSVDSGLIWAFVGPAVAIIIFNLVCLIIVLKVMFSTKAMAQKKKVDKAKTGIRSLLVLVPLMGVSWILGIFYINKDFYWIQYVFAICNGLQGFFIFLFHCLLNPQIKSARAAQKRRKSSSTFKSTMRTTSRGDSKIVKDHSSNEVSGGNEETSLKRKGSSAEKYFANSISEEDKKDDNVPPLGVSNGSNIRLNISSFNKSSI